MKASILTLIFVSVFATANAAIEFVGYGSFDRSRKFALVDNADGRTGWVSLGANFGGFRVAEYLRESETLMLVGKNETLRLVLRAASFTIPAEVTGAEREAQFFKKMREMQAAIGPGKKLYPVEDYIATASQFGREIVSCEIQNGTETIVMELPGAMRPAPDKDGKVRKSNFTLQMTRRDKSKVKLIVR